VTFWNFPFVAELAHIFINAQESLRQRLEAPVAGRWIYCSGVPGVRHGGSLGLFQIPANLIALPHFGQMRAGFPARIFGCGTELLERIIIASRAWRVDLAAGA